jgi:hypothetical protein
MAEFEEVPDVHLVAIRDGVVSTSTCDTYVKEIFTFLLWCRLEEPEVLTEWGLRKLNEFVLEPPQELTARILFPLIRARFDDLLRNADSAPVVKLEEITPDLYMNYSRQLRNSKTRSYLGKSTIQVKRSALFHLFRLHNGEGYNEGFKQSLNILFRGLFRVLTNRVPGMKVPAVGNDNNDNPDRVYTRWNMVRNFCFKIFL